METLYFTEFINWLGDHILIADLYLLGLIVALFLITAFFNLCGVLANSINNFLS